MFEVLFIPAHPGYRYNEAIVLFKSPKETPWHAAALEGLATIPVVEAWSSTQGVVGVINCWVLNGH